MDWEKALIKTIAISSEEMATQIIRNWMKSDKWEVRESAMKACTTYSAIFKAPADIIALGLQDENPHVQYAALVACFERPDVPAEGIIKIIQSRPYGANAIDLAACVGRDDIPVDLIFPRLRDNEPIVQEQAASALAGRKLPLEVIVDTLTKTVWPNDRPRPDECIGVLFSCMGNNVPFEIIAEYYDTLRYHDYDIKEAFLHACIGCDIPLETAKEWLKSDDHYRQLAVLYSHMGRNAPCEIIDLGLSCENLRVRELAMYLTPEV